MCRSSSSSSSAAAVSQRATPVPSNPPFCSSSSEQLHPKAPPLCKGFTQQRPSSLSDGKQPWGSSAKVSRLNTWRLNLRPPTSICILLVGGETGEPHKKPSRHEKNLYAALLFMLMMTALMDCGVGAPTGLPTGLPTDLPTEGPSGEGDEGTTDLLSDSPVWRSLLDATHRHKQEFDREFTGSIEYLHLDNFNMVSFPEDCRNTSLNMEGCLRRLVRGLLVYQVLLKHVEREYPRSEVLPNIKYSCSLLISATRQKMKKPDVVKTLSKSQEDNLLKEVGHTDIFHRKMFAHNILRKLHEFIRDTQVSIKRRERRPGYLYLV
ncbi:hypothetical protein WMY93_019534 [Mugilogobius chulae]|uniref:Interleukin-6 n=1 Tax=Mugilogobius chulae TaxID=88201 RepID=A0AAW0NEP0_9GOBI